MADFRFKVGADYSEFLASSRGVISGLRGELRSLQQQATAHVREQGNVQGVSGQLAGFQGRGQALLDEAMQRGVINQSQYNEQLAGLKNDVAKLRDRLQREASSQGLGGRIPEIDPGRVDAARSGLAGQFEQQRFAARRAELDAATRRAAQETAKQAALEAGNTVRVEEKAALLRRSLEEQQAEIVAQRQNVQLIAQVNNERRKMVAELRRAEIGQAHPGVEPGGSVWQRLQAFVANRRSGGERLPEEFQSFGQFFTSKAITTGGFALSGAVLYGGVQAFRDTIREASALQRELSIVKSQFDEVGASADATGRQPGFKEFARQVVDVSVDTGIAADEVARVSRQLAGVFKTDTGLPDFNRALEQTHQALKLSQVTGLPYQEITDSLTAITSTFGTSFTTIGDLAVGLEQRFGVLAPEIIKFTADLAPVAKELGFTVDQIAALGAIAQQRSGVSGGALAESFNRALPTIRGNQVGLAELLGQRQATADFARPVLNALSEGKGAQVIAQLTEAYALMTKGQRNALAELLGGQRNAKAFFAVLQGGKDTIDALNNSNPDQFAGKLDQRFTDFQATVEFAFQRAGRALEQFGLSLFNSGIADGLKLIADNGAVVAQFVAQLIALFSTFNDALGGIPVKLLAIYTTLRLISALRSNVSLTGITGALRGRVAQAETQAAGAINTAESGGILPPGITSTVAQDAARRAPLLNSRLANFAKSRIGLEVGEGVVASGVKAQLAGLAESLAPVIAITAVSALVQTVGNVNAALKSAQDSLVQKIRDEIDKGTSTDEIVRRAREAGGFGSATGSQAGDVVLKLLTLGTADTKSPGDKAIDALQRDNAKRQGEELAAIFKGANEQQRKALADAILNSGTDIAVTLQPQLQAAGTDPDLAKRLAKPGQLEEFLKRFLADPTNNNINDAVVAVVKQASEGASPEVKTQLAGIAAKYSAIADQSAVSREATDFLATLEDVKAQYEAGNASLAELLAAENHEIDLLRTNLAITTDPKTKTDFAKKLAAEVKARDQVIAQAAQRAADVSIKFAGVQGGNVVAATAAARLQQALTIIQQGGSPDAQLDATLTALDAQQALLNQAVNAPVIVNGIARAPTTAEKLARLAAGIAVPPALRTAIIRARLASGTMRAAVESLAQETGGGVDDLVTQLTQTLMGGDADAIRAVELKIEHRVTELEGILRFIGTADPLASAQVQASIDALKAADDALKANTIDPGPTTKGDPTDLTNQKAIDDSNEAKAYQQALIAQERARAHGDPIGVAQAGIREAQLALQYANASGKPSEVAAAQAQLIDAQNQLDDANAAIVQARFQYAVAASTGDPVKQAQLQLWALKEAAKTVHGEAARLQNEAAQIAAEHTLHDAMQAIIHAQTALAIAVAEAAGKTVDAAKLGLQDAQQKLNDLLLQGADPNGAAVLDAQRAAVQAQANVRDQTLATNERNIDFALQMEKITTQQAIAQFEALLQIPGLTEEQTQQILLKIKQLQGELSKDLQFDIPSEIKQPTLYEVRRLVTASQTPSGPGTYQDNRTYSLFDHAVIGSNVDMQAAVDSITEAIGAPPRNGQYLSPIG